jgi:hypothetical protein
VCPKTLAEIANKLAPPVLRPCGSRLQRWRRSSKRVCLSTFFKEIHQYWNRVIRCTLGAERRRSPCSLPSGRTIGCSLRGLTMMMVTGFRLQFTGALDRMASPCSRPGDEAARACLHILRGASELAQPYASHLAKLLQEEGREQDLVMVEALGGCLLDVVAAARGDAMVQDGDGGQVSNGAGSEAARCRT